MTTRLAFSIPGEPRGKARPRAVPSLIWRDGQPEAVVRLVTPKDTVEAERAILDLFRAKFPDHKPWTGAVLIRFTAVFETPRSFNKALQAAAAAGTLYCTKKPDKDNIEKLIADALTPPTRRRGDRSPRSPAGYAWVEDSQIMGGGIKRYGSPARVDVVLELLPTGDAPPTPGQKRVEARVAGGRDRSAEKPLRASPHKSEPKSKLQQAIDAAIEREGRSKPAPRGPFRGRG